MSNERTEREIRLERVRLYKMKQRRIEQLLDEKKKFDTKIIVLWDQNRRILDEMTLREDEIKKENKELIQKIQDTKTIRELLDLKKIT